MGGFGRVDGIHRKCVGIMGGITGKFAVASTAVEALMNFCAFREDFFRHYVRYVCKQAA